MDTRMKNEPIDYADLIGLEYAPEINDCFQLGRKYYAKLGIEVRDHAFPSDFWLYDADLYRKFFAEEGFKSLDTDDWVPQLHDVMLVQGNLTVPFPTHAGILVEPNLILHHFTGRLSEVTAFKGRWRRPGLVLRHKDVTIEETKPKVVDITELMPLHVRRKFVRVPEDEV